MNSTITLPRSVVEQALKALKIGHESAHDCAETFHIEMAGYKQQRHEALDAEVKQISDAIGALHTALEQPQDHPEQRIDMAPPDWKLVPVEPTKGMKAAGAFAAMDQVRRSYNPPGAYIPVDSMALLSYRAMLSAAPQPPTAEKSLAVQPQVEQEPVAWRWNDEWGYSTIQSVKPCHEATPLYTHPQPKREPLTDAQINDLRLALPYDGEDLPDPWDFKQGVRAAERVHRIGGEA